MSSLGAFFFLMLPGITQVISSTQPNPKEKLRFLCQNVLMKGILILTMDELKSLIYVLNFTNVLKSLFKLTY